MAETVLQPEKEEEELCDSRNHGGCRMMISVGGSLRRNFTVPSGPLANITREPSASRARVVDGATPHVPVPSHPSDTSGCVFPVMVGREVVTRHVIDRSKHTLATLAGVRVKLPELVSQQSARRLSSHSRGDPPSPSSTAGGDFILRGSHRNLRLLEDAPRLACDW